MEEIILTRPDAIEAIPSPEAIVEHESTGDPTTVKEEYHDS